jgi:hypothetical protein
MTTKQAPSFFAAAMSTALLHRPRAARIGALFALALLLSVGTRAADSALAQLESGLADWLRLRAQLGAESAAWQEQREWLTREIALLEREQADLERELETLRSGLSAAEQEDAGALAARDRDRAALAGVRAALAAGESRQTSLRARVPPGREDRLPSPPPPGAPEAARLASLLESHAAWENLGREVSAGRAVLDPGTGTRREVHLLHLGTAQALALALDEREAWLGANTAEGWRWSAVPGAEAAVQAALAVVRKEKPPRLVSLPLLPPPAGTSP